MVDSILEARQRSAVRRAVALDCEVVAERGFRLIGRRALDLSTEGMLVETEEPVALGEDVVLAFRAPGGRSWIDGEARIARIVEGRRRTDRGRCIGLRFGTMDRVSRVMLHASLAGRPPPVPLRHARRDYATTVRLIAMW